MSYHRASAALYYDMTLHARGVFGEINRGERDRGRTQCSFFFLSAYRYNGPIFAVN